MATRLETGLNLRTADQPGRRRPPYGIEACAGCGPVWRIEARAGVAFDRSRTERGRRCALLSSMHLRIPLLKVPCAPR